MIKEITKETEINKLLKKQRETGSSITILFHSLWDPYSQALVQKLRESYNKDIYLVNSFDTPHAFVIHKLQKAPALVTLKGKRSKVEERLPAIYYALGLKDLPSS